MPRLRPLVGAAALTLLLASATGSPNVAPGAKVPGTTSANAVPSFVGSWQLVSYRASRPSDEVLLPYGAHPVGLRTYDPSGHMAVQIMQPDRPNSDDPDEAQTIAADDAYSAYFGAYTLNPGRDTVIHHVVGSLDTRRIGVDQVRNVTLVGNRLTLRAVFGTGTDRQVQIIVWERL